MIFFHMTYWVDTHTAFYVFCQILRLQEKFEINIASGNQKMSYSVRTYCAQKRMRNIWSLFICCIFLRNCWSLYEMCHMSVITVQVLPSVEKNKGLTHRCCPPGSWLVRVRLFLLPIFFFIGLNYSLFNALTVVLGTLESHNVLFSAH